MNTYFTKALFFVLLLLLSVNVSAQKKNRHLRAADEAYNNKQYSLAVDKYKKGYSKIKSDRKEKARVSFLLAQCYRYTNNYRRAKAFYKRALRMDYANQNPEAFLIYADMLLISGEYEDALEAYQKYSEYVPDNPSSLVGVESCKIAPTWLKNPTNFEIDKFNKINSKSDDFAPAYADAYFSSIIFTSNREEATGDEEDPWTGQKFSDLFYAKQDRKGDWSTPALIDKKEKVNTTGNEGKPAFNKLYTTMYFTRCQTDPEKPSGCQIYKATRSGKNWGTPKEIQFSKDSTDVFGHPTINSDETMIIFASDIPGTSGGKDLYYATRESISDPFERPINLGELVNTEKDEMFPFLRNDSTLYFSSNGHIGMGGLDIYKSELKNGVWQTPENMKYPINTNYDDFSITIQPNRDEGFFASNRKGARGGDDIFHFLNPPLEFTLSGIVKNENSLQFVEKADVKLIGSDGSSVKAITDPKGFFSFSQSQIKPNTSYEIVIEKENYFNKKATESTVGIEKSQEIVRNLTLQPIPDKPILLPEILYDLGKWELKSQYQDSLQGLIETLDANQTIIVELAAHTDTRASDEFNDILSQKRAESVVDYLIKRGIDPVRLVAKGYGERVPRTIFNTINRNGFTFEQNSILTQEYIDALQSEEAKETAHQMNRRTEFSVLRKDFVPKSDKNISSLASKIDVVQNPESNRVNFIPGAGESIIIPSIINGYNYDINYIKRIPELYVSLDFALELLKKGIITKNDFDGNAEEILADGTILNRATFTINELRIGNNKIQNIKAKVNHDVSVSILLGKDILEKFGEFEIDKKKFQIIF